MRYKILPHTADLRLKVYGDDYEDLFRNAALGMANVLLEDIEKKTKFLRGGKKVKAEGKDYETLLINFLNELLAISNIDKKVYPKAKILRLSPKVVEAVVSGIAVDGFDEDIKAVSYYDLEIKKTETGKLSVEIVLDI